MFRYGDIYDLDQCLYKFSLENFPFIYQIYNYTLQTTSKTLVLFYSPLSFYFPRLLIPPVEVLGTISFFLELAIVDNPVFVRDIPLITDFCLFFFDNCFL